MIRRALLFALIGPPSSLLSWFAMVAIYGIATGSTDAEQSARVLGKLASLSGVIVWLLSAPFAAIAGALSGPFAARRPLTLGALFLAPLLVALLSTPAAIGSWLVSQGPGAWIAPAVSGSIALGLSLIALARTYPTERTRPPAIGTQGGTSKSTFGRRGAN